MKRYVRSRYTLRLDAHALHEGIHNYVYLLKAFMITKASRYKLPQYTSCVTSLNVKQITRTNLAQIDDAFCNSHDCSLFIDHKSIKMYIVFY